MSELRTLQDQIARLFATEMHLEVPSVDMDLFETGVLDSMAFVELVLHLEQTFGLTIAIEDLELDNFRSVARIATYVTRQNGKAGAT